MAECQGMIEGQAQKSGIQMTFPRFDKPCFVHADRTRLTQIAHQPAVQRDQVQPHAR